MDNYDKIIETGVGAAVICLVECMGCPPGTRAIVYEVYRLPGLGAGISLLSETGKDWGGFSKGDIENCLQYLGSVELDYKATSSMTLANDIRHGYFDQALDELKRWGEKTVMVVTESGQFSIEDFDKLRSRPVSKGLGPVPGAGGLFPEDPRRS